MADNLAYQDDYVEEYRSEMLNGIIVMMAPASSTHTYVSGNIFYCLKRHLEGRQCVPFGDNLLVHLTEQDQFIPDVMVVCDHSKIRQDGIYGAPDLVVEVLSPSTARNDRGYKKSAYESAGVREYWLVDAAHRSIEVYILENGRFAVDNICTLYSPEALSRMTDEEQAAISTELHCHLYDDLVIPLEDIFSSPF